MWLVGVGPLAGAQLRAAFYVETLVPEDAEPCLMHGDAVAGTVRSVGEGRAWLLGTLIGHSGTAYRAPESHAAVSALLARCGVAAAHSGELLLRKRVLPDKEAWLFTNPTGSAITEAVSVAGWTHVEDPLGPAPLRTGDGLMLAVDPLDVRVLIVSRV